MEKAIDQLKWELKVYTDSFEYQPDDPYCKGVVDTLNRMIHNLRLECV